MEHSAIVNNLSEQGLYRSLKFATYMDEQEKPQPTKIYALFDKNYKYTDEKNNTHQALPDLAPLQAIQYYSVYKRIEKNGVKTNILQHNNPGECNSKENRFTGNCKVIHDLIQSSTGNELYVLSMPNEDINSVLNALKNAYSVPKDGLPIIPNEAKGVNIELTVNDKKKFNGYP